TPYMQAMGRPPAIRFVPEVASPRVLLYRERYFEQKPHAAPLFSYALQPPRAPAVRLPFIGTPPSGATEPPVVADFAAVPAEPGTTTPPALDQNSTPPAEGAPADATPQPAPASGGSSNPAGTAAPATSAPASRPNYPNYNYLPY